MRVWSAERVFVKGRFERDWALMVDDSGTIQAVGPRRQLVSKANQVIHYPQSAILPSFVNPHHHGFQTVFRGVADQMTSYSELLNRLVWPLSRVIDADLMDALYHIAFAEQAISGVSTVTEFHYLHNGSYREGQRPAFAERIIEIALAMGLRINLVYAFFDQGMSEATEAFIEPMDLSINHFELLIQKYGEHPMVRILPGVHGLEHTSPEAIVAAGELSKKYDVPLHVQLAERDEELRMAETQYGTTPLRALELMELVDERLVVVNGTLLDDGELELLKKNGARVIICPSASLAKGEDAPNVYGMLRHGIPFSIGSDSVCTSNCYSPPEEIKWIEFMQRNQQSAFNVLNRQAEIGSLWDLATVHAAQATSCPAGSLMPGAPADFLLVNIEGPSFRPRWNFSAEAFMNQLIFGWGPQIQLLGLVVGGQKIVNQGQLLQASVEKSYDRLEQWSEAFLRSAERGNDSESSEVKSETTAS